MTQLEKLQTRIAVLEEHISKIEGTIHIILEELENDTIIHSAKSIRESLEPPKHPEN